MKNRRAVIMALALAALFCSCQTSQQESAVITIDGADGVRRGEKDFGSYEVPDDFVEDAVYSRQQAGKCFYVSKADEKKHAKSRKQFVNNISVNMGDCPYSAEDHEAFREAILYQLMMQMQFFTTQVANYEAVGLSGNGSYTDAGDVLYTFTFEYKIDGIAETTTHHYIVGDQKFVLVHETARGDTEEIDRAALRMAESFRWAD